MPEQDQKPDVKIDTKPIEESVKDLLESPGELQRTKALHVGKADELLERKERIEASVQSEPLARILQDEVGRLRMDVNKIMIYLGIDNKTEVLLVKDIPIK